MRAPLTLLLSACLAMPAPVWADGRPEKVMSLNLCADQLLLTLADTQQIASLSWLASDPDDSAMAEAAAEFPKNYGSTEELIRLQPDLVVAGQFTAPFTVSLARRLGYPVVLLPPANSLAQTEANLRTLGEALQQAPRAERIISETQERLRRLAAARETSAVPAVLIRAGSFTVGAGSLSNELMTLAGFHNVAAEGGLDSWGSLSLETLLTSGVDVLIFSTYRDNAPSLANHALQHPAMATLVRRLKIRRVPGSLLACGGPQNVKAVELMAEPPASGRT